MAKVLIRVMCDSEEAQTIFDQIIHIEGVEYADSMETNAS